MHRRSAVLPHGSVPTSGPCTGYRHCSRHEMSVSCERAPSRRPTAAADMFLMEAAAAPAASEEGPAQCRPEGGVAAEMHRDKPLPRRSLQPAAAVSARRPGREPVSLNHCQLQGQSHGLRLQAQVFELSHNLQPLHGADVRRRRGGKEGELLCSRRLDFAIGSAWTWRATGETRGAGRGSGAEKSRCSGDVGNLKPLRRLRLRCQGQ